MADLHLGKAGHFRKSGIPVPAKIHQDDLSELNSLITNFQPEKVLILGDLFHSVYNNEWKDFADLLSRRSDINFILIKGNHDILPDEVYEIDNLAVNENALVISPFCFSHKPAFTIPDLHNESFITENNGYQAYYNISGHIHPGISVQGKLGQRIRMPCFYFTKEGGILPAFGKFTGCKCLRKTAQNFIFGIAEISKSQKKVFQIV